MRSWVEPTVERSRQLEQRLQQNVRLARQELLASLHAALDPNAVGARGFCAADVLRAVTDHHELARTQSELFGDVVERQWIRLIFRQIATADQTSKRHRQTQICEHAIG